LPAGKWRTGWPARADQPVQGSEGYFFLPFLSFFLSFFDFFAMPIPFPEKLR